MTADSHIALDCIDDGGDDAMLAPFPALEALGVAASQLENPSPPPVLIDVAYSSEGIDCGLGLYALEPLPRGTFVGEYTGVLTTGSAANSYSCNYPSYAGDAQVSALRYGNHVRCINHSATPNVKFIPVMHGGIPRIVAVLIADVAAGDQILVNYGPAYWGEHATPAEDLSPNAEPTPKPNPDPNPSPGA
mmetsp:Transcript_16112/g.49244  ORF Transcript_16112/g.49244 Transcript_16112/m.49244 type:complete len:190 (-) Transcript_16112:329-898(-)